MEGHKRHTQIGKSYDIGVIGLEEGKGLIKGLKGHPELQVVAICDVNIELVDDIQKEIEVPN
jgi:hypothetical protein